MMCTQSGEVNMKGERTVILCGMLFDDLAEVEVV